MGWKWVNTKRTAAAWLSGFPLIKLLGARQEIIMVVKLQNFQLIQKANARETSYELFVNWQSSNPYFSKGAGSARLTFICKKIIKAAFTCVPCLANFHSRELPSCPHYMLYSTNITAIIAAPITHFKQIISKNRVVFLVIELL